VRRQRQAVGAVESLRTIADTPGFDLAGSKIGEHLHSGHAARRPQVLGGLFARVATVPPAEISACKAVMILAPCDM